MKFIAKKSVIIVLIYLVLWLFLGLTTYLYAKDEYVIYWDGLKVNEEKLAQLCNVTSEEYWDNQYEVTEKCPEVYDALEQTGGVETEWETVKLLLIVISVAYNFLFLGTLSTILILKKLFSNNTA